MAHQDKLLWTAAGIAAGIVAGSIGSWAVHQHLTDSSSELSHEPPQELMQEVQKLHITVEEVLEGPKVGEDRPISRPHESPLSGGETSSEEEKEEEGGPNYRKFHAGFVAHSRKQGKDDDRKATWARLRQAVLGSAMIDRWKEIATTGVFHPGEEDVEGLDLSYTKVWSEVPTIHQNMELVEAAKDIMTALQLRERYKSPFVAKCKGGHPSIEFLRGVVMVSGVKEEHGHEVNTVMAGPSDNFPMYPEYVAHVKHLKARVAGDGQVSSFAHTRLGVLEILYKCHRLLNGGAELDETRTDGRDFWGIRKVDRVDLNRACPPNMLVANIRRRVEDSPSEIVLDGGVLARPRTLSEVFDALDVALDELNVDCLNVMSSAGNGFSRATGLSLSNAWSLGGRMTPATEKGSSAAADLRKVFLSRKNAVHGKYFAEITRQVFRTISPYTFVEFRLQFDPTQPTEWKDLSEWVIDNELDHPRIRWIISINREADLLLCATFQDVLRNLFVPLFEATLDPQRHHKLAQLLTRVVGMDMIGDEEWHGSHLGCSRSAPPPGLWSCKKHGSPSWMYWVYHIWANLGVLNRYRDSKKMNTIQFTLHAGEQGSMSHPSAAFLLADSVVDGLRLSDSPGLQYLYYLSEIPVVMAPLAHNCLSIPLMMHPLKRFLQIGLRVSLSTDAPLKFNLTGDPLVEEFSVAAACFRFSTADLAELARNSVADCALSKGEKERILGRNWQLGGAAGNDPRRTDVPNIRVHFRYETWRAEMSFLRSLCQVEHIPRPLKEGNGTVSSGLRFALAKGVPVFSPEEVRAGAALVWARRTRCVYHVLNEEARKAAEQFSPIWLHKGSPFDTPLPTPSPMVADMSPSGILRIWATKEARDEFEDPLFHAPPTLHEYIGDLNKLMEYATDAEVKLLSHRRLTLLSWLFVSYRELNHGVEAQVLKKGPRDIHSVPVVDTHVHAASCSTAPHLRDYILETISARPNAPVQRQGGGSTTLNRLCQDLGIGSDLSVDHLGVTADHGVFRRFDRFNQKFSVAGSGELRSAFLKTSNPDGGKLFARLIKQVISRGGQEGRQFAEYRLSIYGADAKEWEALARWAISNDMHHPNVRWVIQVPRLYWLQKKRGKITCFGDMLKNVFEPLVAAVLDPPAHPFLFRFMQIIVGLDSVDDESTPEERLPPGDPPSPKEWTAPENPPYHYQLYYMATNLRLLNHLMIQRGLRPWSFRPHAGEAGSLRHLGCAYLLADGVNHGIMLQNSPPLQYLYFIDQLGLAVAPMSNNRLFLGIRENPFNVFFQRGLNVSLSTDDPLQFHSSFNPLQEEYGVAASVWHLSQSDICEIARNSVLQSGLEKEKKEELIGSSIHDTFALSNVPAMRLHFRKKNLEREDAFLQLLTSLAPALEEEKKLTEDYREAGRSVGVLLPVSRRRPVLRRARHSEGELI